LFVVKILRESGFDWQALGWFWSETGHSAVESGGKSVKAVLCLMDTVCAVGRCIFRQITHCKEAVFSQLIDTASADAGLGTCCTFLM
jgi:hypothetical protein